MLIDFRFANFRSFKDEQTFSMQPVKEKSKVNQISNFFTYAPDKSLLLTCAIYGANASGKTNVLRAMALMAELVTEGHKLQKGESLRVEPFRLDEQRAAEPSSFDVQFIVDGIKYAYGFVIQQDKVLEEYLYSWPNERQKMIFERFETTKYRFVTEKAKQKTIAALTADNMLYLANANRMNLSFVTQPFEWFRHRMTTMLEIETLFTDAYVPKLIAEYPDLMSELIDAMKVADVGIESITVKPRAIQYRQNIFAVREHEELLRDIMSHEIKAIHRLASGKNVEFEWMDESRGTRKFVSLMLQVLRSLKYGRVMLVDELDGSLHPMLTEYIIGLFHSIESNPHHAQLIFTTHDTNLLSSTKFRRDQIWFTEKDHESGASSIYSLADLKIRNDENYEKGYLSGRYGAIPFVHEGNKNE